MAKMNVKLLRKVAKHILAEPKRFLMWTFRETNQYGEKSFTSDANDNRAVLFAKCGTAACIAGWTCILSGERNPDDWAKTAEGILGITGADGSKLFYVHNWPDKFRDAYEAAKTQPKFVKIAAARIEHFIKTGE